MLRVEKTKMKIKKNVIQAIINHAKKSFPVEACGYFAGVNNEILECYEMTNVDNSPEHFSFSPEEQFEVYKKARKAGFKIIGVYHSHPYTPARMSEEDLKLAYDESLYYAIVSLERETPVFKMFKVENKKPLEKSYEIIE